MQVPSLPYVRGWAGPDGPPFLCLHAVGGSHAHWIGVAPALAQHARVLAVDLAGFGRTPIPATGAGLDADRVLISRLLGRDGPAILVGSSYGGSVALLQAAREPSSVTALILSGSLLPAAHEGAGSLRSALVRRRLRQRVDGVRRAARAFADGSLRLRPASMLAHALRSNAADPASIDATVIDASVAVAAEQRTWSTMRAVAQVGRSTFSLWTHPERFAQILDRVSCPVLVIHGAHDRTVPVEHAAAAARAHPEWRLHVFADLGHLPHMEDPAGWMAVVDDWLETLLA